MNQSLYLTGCTDMSSCLKTFYIKEIHVYSYIIQITQFEKVNGYAPLEMKHSSV